MIMSLLFANFSSDYIQLQIENQSIILQHSDSEYSIPKALHDLYSTYQYTDIVMLNGPGGFTSLRVWSLSLNMISKLYPDSVRLYSLSKTILYHHCANILADQVIMRIGQQKNYRLYSPSQQTHTLIQDRETWECYDQMRWDKFQTYTDKMIIIKASEIWLSINYKNKNITLTKDQLQQYQVDFVVPNYLIDPTITPKKLS